MANKKTSKTYFGIPKTPIDDNTVFYASLDGTTVAEVGDILATKNNLGAYILSPTGLANMFSGASSVSSIKLNSQLIGFPLTCDMVITPKSMLTATGSSFYLSTLINGDGSKIIAFQIEKATLKTTFYTTGLTGLTVVLNNRINIAEGQSYHVRFIATTSFVKVYVNGVLSLHITGTFNATDFTSLMIGQTSANYGFNGGIADISVSNTDKGNYFPTLPQDFIDGYAKISPAFNPQRSTFSDVLTSEYSCDIVKAYSPNRPKQHTVTQAVAGSWASADTVKIKGLAGEIIGGVIDTDTALARITGQADIRNIYVDDVSKLSVGDTFRVYNITDGTVWGFVYSVSAISGNTITTNGDISSSNLLNLAIVEATASSSSPLVKFNNAGTITTVVGTWSNLGTNEATFTLGTNAGLTNQDIQIEYSLNMTAGQGQIDVFSKTLGGEILAKDYDPKFTKLSTDFNSKVSGSVVENPNIAKGRVQSSLAIPSAFTYELNNTELAKIITLDYIINSTTGSSNGDISQQLFSFDIIALVERKYGIIPASTVADKVTWLVANIDKITCNWYGYGSCPSGNKANVRVWYTSWSGTSTHSYSTPSPLSIGVATTAIQSDGFVYVLACSDASNGTIASSISTDYIGFDVVLKYEAKQTLIGVPYNLVPRKLVSSTTAIRDDFTGKISGSTVENPHTFKTAGNGTLYTPSQFVSEETDTKYNNIKVLDGVLSGVNSPTNTAISQQLFSFNLIRMIEDKFGVIPALDKVAWLKANISKIQLNWYGYGSNPSGNKAYLDIWQNNSSVWYYNNAGLKNNISSSSSTVSMKAISTTSPANQIDANGFIHFMAYTDASDGVTASTIYTDYANLEIELITPTGYDILVPENPRRDDGQSNVVLVRKETREVQTMFSATNENEIVVYGEYIPPTPILGTTEDVTILAELDNFLISDVSTASAHQVSLLRAKAISTILRQNNVVYLCNFEIAELPVSAETRRVNIGKKVKVNATGFYDNYEIQSSSICRINNFIGALAYLVAHNGEIKLMVMSKDSGANKYLELSNTGSCMLLSLPTKPLAKISDGKVIAKLLETPLRNSILTNTNTVYNTITNTNIIKPVTWGDLG